MHFFQPMLKKQASQKGFSLVEIIIVVAILSILVSIAFNAFSAVLINSKKRADEQQAKNIEKAIRVFMSDTEKIKLKTLISAQRTFYTTEADARNSNSSQNALPPGSNNKEMVSNLIIGLQKTLYIKDAMGIVRSHGPYLTGTEQSGIAKYESFAPQWNEDAGGSHKGYHIKLFVTTNNVIVEPTTEDVNVQIQEIT